MVESTYQIILTFGDCVLFTLVLYDDVACQPLRSPQAKELGWDGAVPLLLAISTTKETGAERGEGGGDRDRRTHANAWGELELDRSQSPLCRVFL